MATEVIEIQSDEGALNDPILVVSDPDDDIPLDLLSDVMEVPSSPTSVGPLPLPDDDVVPVSIADELARELKKTDKPQEMITSEEVTGWAVEQQVVDLEDGEIIDDELIHVSTDLTRTINIMPKRKRNRKMKKRPPKRSKFALDWSRSVTVTHHQVETEDYGSLLQKYQEVQEKIAESDAHFPSIANDPSYEIIDICSPHREESEEDNDDDTLFELRKRALLSENKRRLSRPVKVFCYEYEKKQKPVASKVAPLDVNKHRSLNKWQFKKDKDKWKAIQRTCSTESAASSDVQWIGPTTQTVAVQVGPGDFDNIEPQSMEVESESEQIPGSISLRRKPSESEQEMRDKLLKQVMIKRGRPPSIPTIHANPTKFGAKPLVKDSRGRSRSFDTTIAVDVIPRMRSESADQTHQPVIPGISPTLSAPGHLDPASTTVIEVIPEELGEIEQPLPLSILDTAPLLPDLAEDSPLPPVLPANETGNLLPLHPPLFIEGSSSSSDESDNEDIENLEHAKEKIEKHKETIRLLHMKIGRSRQSVGELKEVKRVKMNQKKLVTEALEELMVKTASYERYLRDSTEFQRSLKTTMNNLILEMGFSKKDILEKRVEISNLQDSFGLDDADADENRKIIMRAKLNQQKDELEKKLKRLCNTTQAQIDHQTGAAEASQVQSPSVAEVRPSSTLSENHKSEEKLAYKEKTFIEMATRRKNGRPFVKLAEEEPSYDLENDQSLKTYSAKDLKSLEQMKYVSPLMKFRSYRFSPYFRRQNFNIASESFTHKVNISTPICAYSFSGKCNDDRCLGQHRRDITMKGDEIFLDLLAYNREIIRMDSFDNYNDQLKATQALLNRILPSELVLNMSQKCILLVEEINRVSAIDEPHIVSKYCADSSKGFKCMQNQRSWKAISYLGSTPESPEELYYNDDQACRPGRYFYDEVMEETIKQLEDETLEDPKDIDAYLLLVQKYLTSNIPNADRFALAVLSEALEINPTAPALWREYISLYEEIFGASSMEYQQVIDFCEDNCDLDPGFWEFRINNSRETARTIERYIARIIGSEDPEEFQTQLLNASIYRSFLYTLEPDASEAADFLSGIPELLSFPSSSECLIWLTVAYLRIKNKFPVAILPLDQTCDLSREVAPTFDFTSDSFDLLFPEIMNIEKILSPNIDVIDEIAAGVQSAISNWDNQPESEHLITKLVEIIVACDPSKSSYAHSIARQLAKCRSVWVLAGNCLSGDPMAIFGEALSKLANDPQMSYLVGRKFLLSEESDDLCANGISCLEDMILPFYASDAGMLYESGNLTLSDLIRGVIERDNPGIIDNSTLEPHLPEFRKGKAEFYAHNMAWIWLAYLLLESFVNPDKDLTKLYVSAISSVRAHNEIVSSHFVIWALDFHSSNVSVLFQKVFCHFADYPNAIGNRKLLGLCLERLSESNKLTLCRHLMDSQNLSLVEHVSWIFLENKRYMSISNSLRPIVQTGRASTELYSIFIVAEKKLNSRSCDVDVVDFSRRFPLSREVIRSCVLYWKESADTSNSSKQLASLRENAEFNGLGQLSSLFQDP